jgi:hypothetical protein
MQGSLCSAQETPPPSVVAARVLGAPLAAQGSLLATPTAPGLCCEQDAPLLWPSSSELGGTEPLQPRRACSACSAGR